MSGNQEKAKKIIVVHNKEALAYVRLLRLELALVFLEEERVMQQV